MLMICVLVFLLSQREQMLEAQEMFKTANKVTRPEKALILGFMAGSRGTRCQRIAGCILQIAYKLFLISRESLPTSRQLGDDKAERKSGTPTAGRRDNYSGDRGNPLPDELQQRRMEAD